MTKANLKNILAAVRDIINRSSEVGIRKAQAAEKRADNAQTAATNAQITADNAQTTADNAQAAAGNAQTAADNAQAAANAAQTTADNAQTAANAAQTDADNAQATINNIFVSGQRELEFSFDKKTDGRDSFVFNAYRYYKISEFAPSKESVISFVGTRENGDNLSYITHGIGCDGYGLFIVVTSTSNPTLPIEGTEVTMGFSPPSTGLYAMYTVGNISMTAGTAKFTVKSGQAIVLMSSTADSTKKFKITVDDSGTLSATEVTA